MTPIVTNNEFMSWVVKGYIAKAKGWPINWAKATAYIAREKAWRESIEKMQHAFGKLQFLKPNGVLKLNGGEALTSKLKGDVLKGATYLKQGCPNRVQC